MTQTKKLRPGFARMQFIAIAQRAHELMELGHTVQSAFDELHNENKITMTYDTFRKHLKGNEKEKDIIKENEAKKEDSSPQSSTEKEKIPTSKIISADISKFSADIPAEKLI